MRVVPGIILWIRIYCESIFDIWTVYQQNTLFYFIHILFQVTTSLLVFKMEDTRLVIADNLKADPKTVPLLTVNRITF